MIIPPEPMRLFDGQRAFIAFGAPWKDAVIALMDPRCGYDPWEYDDGMTPGDVLITVIETQPRVFGCIELIGWDSATDRFTVADKWNLVTLPAVPEWLSLPTLPGPLDHGTGSYLLETLGTQRWGGRLYEAGIESATTAESARVMMNSGGQCAHCDENIWLAGPDARERIHTYVCEANSHVGDHYSDWSTALCTNCYVQMSAGGFTNYLDFRFSENPPCPRCSFRRSVGYFSQPYMTDVPQDRITMGVPQRNSSALGQSRVLAVPPLPFRVRRIAQDRRQILLTGVRVVFFRHGACVTRTRRTG